MRRRRARADQRDGWTFERSGRPARPEHEGRVRDGRQRRRIGSAAPGYGGDAAVVRATPGREHTTVEHRALWCPASATFKKLSQDDAGDAPPRKALGLRRCGGSEGREIGKSGKES